VHRTSCATGETDGLDPGGPSTVVDDPTCVGSERSAGALSITLDLGRSPVHLSSNLRVSRYICPLRHFQVDHLSRHPNDNQFIVLQDNYKNTLVSLLRAVSNT
jgi:hypothetical protein